MKNVFVFVFVFLIIISLLVLLLANMEIATLEKYLFSISHKFLYFSLFFHFIYFCISSLYIFLINFCFSVFLSSGVFILSPTLSLSRSVGISFCDSLSLSLSFSFSFSLYHCQSLYGITRFDMIITSTLCNITLSCKISYYSIKYQIMQ